MKLLNRRSIHHETILHRMFVLNAVRDQSLFEFFLNCRIFQRNNDTGLRSKELISKKSHSEKEHGQYCEAKPTNFAHVAPCHRPHFLIHTAS